MGKDGVAEYQSFDGAGSCTGGGFDGDGQDLVMGFGNRTGAIRRKSVVDVNIKCTNHVFIIH